MTETATTTTLTAYVPPSFVAEADKVFIRYEITPNKAITGFLKRVVELNDLPCDIPELEPNEETLEAMREADDIINGRIPKPPAMSAKEFFDWLKAEDDDDDV